MIRDGSAHRHRYPARSLVQVGRDDVDRAAAAGVIRAEQADPLWAFLSAGLGAPQGAVRPRFDLVHLLWYAGALIVIGAMGLFASLAFARLGGAALAAITLVYAGILAAAGDGLWRRGLLIPGGLLITIAVTMAPLFVYGVQHALGWLNVPGRDFRDLYEFCRMARGSWVPVELATIAAGLVALRFYRFPFLVAPVAVALWALPWTWRLGSSATRRPAGGCASWCRSGSGSAR